MNHSIVKHAVGRPCLLVLVVLACTAAFASMTLKIEQPWIRLLPGDMPMAGSFELVNLDAAPAFLVGAESPGFGEVMLQRSTIVNNTTHVEQVTSVEVPGGASVLFEPGSYHLTLMKRRAALHPGDHVPITLRFKDGRRLTADFEVRPPGGD